MKAHEIKPLMERVTKFNALSARFSVLEELIRKLDNDHVGCSDSPFTGNTRESRRITELNISFSATLGLEKPVEMRFSSLHIPAYDLCKFLELQLKKQQDAVKAEMDAL